MEKNNGMTIAEAPGLAQGMLAIIERVANDPMADVEKLERLLALQERMMTKQAEIEFNEAVSRIAEKMPPIKKNRAVAYDLVKGDSSKGQKEAFKYATLEEIDSIIKPLLKVEKMSVSYTTEERTGGGCIVTGTLRHFKGHSRSASIPLPIDTSGGKNNVQGIGSTFSYGRRYTLCMLLDIVVIGEDNDGQGAPVTDEQAKEIKDGLKESGLDVAKFLKTLKAENVEAILSRDFQRAKTAIDAKLWRNQQEAERKGKANG